MATYRYTNTLLGAKVKGFNNDKEKYNINATKEGLTVSTKNGDIIYEFNYNKNKQCLIHTLGDCIGIEIANRARTHSNFLIFKNKELLKETSLHGTFSNVIVGGEDIYFKKFTGIKGNRAYYRIVNSNGRFVTPEVQIVQHEVNEDDGLDRFYCENYRELSKDEYLEEDDNEYQNNLEEIAVYLSNGRELFYQSYVEPETPASETDKDFHNDMLLGAGLSAINPLAGSIVMANAAIKKVKKNHEAEKAQDSEESTFGE